MALFSTQIIRLAADTSSKKPMIDVFTGGEPEAWWARDLTIQIGVFAGTAVDSVANISSVSAGLKDPSNLDGAPLVEKTIASFDDTLDAANWTAGTKQHFSVAFSDDDLSFAISGGARVVQFYLRVITTDGKVGTLGVTKLNLIDDGGNFVTGDDPSPPDPVTYPTLAEADARYVPKVGGNLYATGGTDLALDVAARNLFGPWRIVDPQVSTPSSAGSLRFSYAANGDFTSQIACAFHSGEPQNNYMVLRVCDGSTSGHVDVLSLRGDGLVSLPGTFQLGDGAVIKKILSATASIDFGTIGAGDTDEFTCTVAGASTSGTPSVALGWADGIPGGIFVRQAFVSADNTVSVWLANHSASDVDAGTHTVRVTVTQF